jgi:hypothetical protein
MKKAKNWKHLGGGCWVKGKEKYPCDDTYENIKTKERVTIYSTIDAHFEMPRETSSISELLKRGIVVRRKTK